MAEAYGSIADVARCLGLTETFLIQRCWLWALSCTPEFGGRKKFWLMYRTYADLKPSLFVLSVVSAKSQDGRH